MREIKYRAWDKKRKEIFPVHELVFNKFNGEPNTIKGYTDDEKDVWNVHGGHFMKYANENRYVLMQYTGLKDKNGKEIFEGDILRCKCLDRKADPDGFNPVGAPYFYRNSVIEWWQSHCNLGYRLRDGKGKTLMIKPSSLRAMDIEIIGNIHEHSHLLEVAV